MSSTHLQGADSFVSFVENALSTALPFATLNQLAHSPEAARLPADNHRDRRSLVRSLLRNANVKSTTIDGVPFSLVQPGSTPLHDSRTYRATRLWDLHRDVHNSTRTRYEIFSDYHSRVQIAEWCGERRPTDKPPYSTGRVYYSGDFELPAVPLTDKCQQALSTKQGKAIQQYHFTRYFLQGNVEEWLEQYDTDGFLRSLSDEFSPSPDFVAGMFFPWISLADYWLQRCPTESRQSWRYSFICEVLIDEVPRAVAPYAYYQVDESVAMHRIYVTQYNTHTPTDLTADDLTVPSASFEIW